MKSPESLPITIRHHPRARRMILRLASDGKSLELTLPKRTSEKAGRSFVASQWAWVARQLAKHTAREVVELKPDVTITLFGQDCLLTHDPTQKGISYQTQNETPTEREALVPAQAGSEAATAVGFGEGSPTKLILGRDIAAFPRRVEDWIKKEARRRYGQMAVDLAAQIGERPAAVTLRDTKSRWGSCSKSRRISLSWRLAFAPAEVARYVIVHEVAHLKHFDHSPAFWATVAMLDPHWESSRDWLRAHGKTLHDVG